jgi:hypothetical protein
LIEFRGVTHLTAAGVCEASLGGGLYKKRIAAKKNKGKRGGSRLLIAYKKGHDLFFMYAFNKNEAGNVSEKEKMALKARAKLYFELSDSDLKKAAKAGIFFEMRKQK